jgi:hypothetical protein
MFAGVAYLNGEFSTVTITCRHNLIHQNG